MSAFPDELMLEPKPAEPPKQTGNRRPRWWLAAAVLILLAKLTHDKVVEWVGGEPQLSQKQQRQLEKELRELDEAEQYVLVATATGWYTCAKCPGGRFYLKIGEVYKYGVTRKGETGRYTDEYLKGNHLFYLRQFKGRLQDCLREEKRKIFRYPILPENLARSHEERLVKPPGNLRTD